MLYRTNGGLCGHILDGTEYSVIHCRSLGRVVVGRRVPAVERGGRSTVAGSIFRCSIVSNHLFNSYQNAGNEEPACLSVRVLPPIVDCAPRWFVPLRRDSSAFLALCGVTQIG